MTDLYLYSGSADICVVLFITNPGKELIRLVGTNRATPKKKSLQQ